MIEPPDEPPHASGDDAPATNRDVPPEHSARSGPTTPGALVLSLAHDLSQPLAAIVANCDTSLLWLRSDPPDIERVARAVERTRRDVQRASAAIERATNLARESATEQSFIDVKELVLQVLDALAPELQRHCIEVRTALPAAVPLAVGSPSELQHVFAIVMANAIESIEQTAGSPREVSIECGRHSQHDGEILFVSVQNSASAAIDVQRETLFDTLVASRSPMLRMALAASRSIIHRHGGDLHARHTNQGLLIEFTIPVLS